jgi:hypothetical protein
MRKVAATAIMTSLLLGGAAACSGDKRPAAYRLSPQPVRDLETALPERPVKLGELVYAVIGIRTDIAAVVGSHADWLPKGQYVRLRISMTNEGRDRHDFIPQAQLLIAGDGKTYKISYDAMQIARQPDGTISIARDERREFDLWFDIPKSTKPRTLRIVGDPTSSALAEQLKGTPSPGTHTTVDISLK